VTTIDSKETTVPREPISGRADTAKGVEQESLTDLKEASRSLKERIIDERRRNDMPIDSALGNPAEEARNADGRNDLPDLDDD
jgi:hypothetical protein